MTMDFEEVLDRYVRLVMGCQCVHCAERIKAAKREAVKAIRASRNGFGQWFPTDLMGNPMREKSPGVWEVAKWSESSELNDQLRPLDPPCEFV